MDGNMFKGLVPGLLLIGAILGVSIFSCATWIGQRVDVDVRWVESKP